MIFRRPDAFIIKHIKFIHMLILLCLIYMLLATSKISDFYVHVIEVKSIVGESNLSSLFDIYMFIANIFGLILITIILALLIKKQKKCVFYIITIILFVSSLVFYIMSYSNIATMQEAAVAAPVYFAYSDISWILFAIQSVFVLIFIVKATGFDFKTFSFGANIIGLDLTEADSEEIEFNLEIDKNELRTKKKHKMRELKYLYVENKFKINLIIFLVIVIMAVLTFNSVKANEEVYYSLGDELTSLNYTLKIDDAYITNIDYKDKKVSQKDMFVILTFKIKKNIDNTMTFNPSNIELMINNEKYYPSNKYVESFSDFGVAYKEQKLTKEYSNYYIVYQIPYEFSTEDIYILTYSSFNYSTNKYNYYIIKAKYKRIGATKTTEFRLNEEMDINAYGINNSVTIKNFDFQNRFKIVSTAIVDEKKYDISEYIVPTASDDEDKTIMKLNYEEIYLENNKLNFSDILLKYGIIEYEIDGIKKEGRIYSYISPTLIKEPDIYYIQVSREVLSGQNRKIKIKVRDQIFTYALD